MAFKREAHKIGVIAVNIFLFLGITATILTACTTQDNIVTASPTTIPTKKQPTETRTPFPTSTLRPTATFASTPTLDIKAALVSGFNIPGVCLFAYLESRDQNWIGADCNLYRELIIAEKMSTNKFTIPYSEISDDDPEYFSVLPLSWSGDNQYFYFTTKMNCCSGYMPYNNAGEFGSLYRLDVNNKTWDILVRAVNTPYYFFSDDGERYLYFNQHAKPGYVPTLEIGMIETVTKQSKRVVLEGYEVDDSLEYIWSQNGRKFGIVLYRPGIINSGWAVLRINFEKMEMELIEEYDRNNLLGENNISISFAQRRCKGKKPVSCRGGFCC